MPVENSKTMTSRRANNWRAVTMAACLCAFPGHAYSQQENAISAGRYVDEPTQSSPSIPAFWPAQSTNPSAEQVSIPKAPLTFEQKIAAAAASRIKTFRGLTEKDKAALKAHYDGDDAKLLWVDEQGLSQRANDLVTELRRADDYGLRTSDLRLPKLDDIPTDIEGLANIEARLSASTLIYARHAKGGRFRAGQLGSQLTENPPVRDPAVVLGEISKTNNPGETLRALHPAHPQFVKLREKLLQLRGGGEKKDQPRLPAGPVLKRGDSHEHVALLRKRLGIDAGANPTSFDEAVEKAVKNFQQKKSLAPDGIVGAGTRAALNGGPSGTKLMTKVLMNMERWRWMPDDINADAGIYIWANIPEFRVRIVKGEQTVFSERAIVGLVTHKTPVFSDKLEWIEIHPTWFVPASIKVADILPSLKRPTSTVMERYNLRVSCAGYGSNYKAIDWNTIDISKCSFSQPPGPKSVLGDFKFKFPNKHSVYMHDTHKPHLFKTSKRTYSHGCVRVDKPRRMAELLLEHDSGMPAERVGEILKGPTVLSKQVLRTPVPVHMTYFTAFFDDDGKFVTRADYYGHDARLSAALSGKTIVADPSTAKKKKIKKLKKKTAQQGGNWWDVLLPN